MFSFGFAFYVMSLKFPISVDIGYAMDSDRVVSFPLDPGAGGLGARPLPPRFFQNHAVFRQFWANFGLRPRWAPMTKILDPPLFSHKKWPLCYVFSNFFSSLISVGYTVPRNPTKDTTFRGYNIPKTASIVGNLHRLHKDPKSFPKPDKFNPGHFLDKKLNLVNTGKVHPFGIGENAVLPVLKERGHPETHLELLVKKSLQKLTGEFNVHVFLFVCCCCFLRIVETKKNCLGYCALGLCGDKKQLIWIVWSDLKCAPGGSRLI